MHRAKVGPKLWFKAKKYGWGWTPCSWQGWAATALFILSVYGVTWAFFDANKNTKIETFSWAVYIGSILVLTLLLIWLASVKGEKAGWRWGRSDKGK